MVIRRGEIWWADMDEPVGASPEYRRPVLVLQANWFNRTRIDTILVAVLTSNLALAQSPGNVLVKPGESGLPRPSVINISQIAAVDRKLFLQRTGCLPEAIMRRIESGLKLILDLED